ncbi:MAG TPA: hypothetical protein VMT20_04015 [Terriglobia bacterium]|nr:hypothetical protein [Terriglobia bacterium]
MNRRGFPFFDLQLSTFQPDLAGGTPALPGRLLQSNCFIFINIVAYLTKPVAFINIVGSQNRSFVINNIVGPSFISRFFEHPAPGRR